MSLRSKVLGNVNKMRVASGQQAKSMLVALKNVPRTKRLTYYTAAVLAFVIAPIAALSLSAKPGTSANLETTTPSVSNSQTSDGAPSTQDGLDASITSKDAQNSTSADVESSFTATVNVNGQEVEVPEDGNVNKTVVGDDGQTTHVSITSNSSSNSSGDKQRTNGDLRINTRTTTKTTTRSSQ